MRYAVLGSIEVRDGDAVRRVSGTQQQRLLAALLTDPGRVIALGRLVDVVWPDGLAPDAAEHSVRKYVHRLRAAIGPGEIATEGTGYLLRPAELDAVEFEELVARARRTAPDAAVAIYDRALALWRGSAFTPFGEEWWALPVASRLEELRIAASEERASALVATGGATRAIPDLQRLVTAHQLRERPVALLASALHASGRSAEALRAINAFRARLADETGLEPSAELVDLERTIAAGSPPSSSWPLRGYVLEGLLGEGASARVYAAVQPGTDRRVALKVIRGEVADTEEFVRRFEAEARMVARLEHPHIVPLYDFWREPGGAYLAFRLLARTADATLVVGGPWSIGRVGEFVEQVGGALLTAHIAGVSHGDITGSNVLLDDAGVAYLADFGLATATDPVPQDARIQRDVADFTALIWKLLAGVAPPHGARPLPALAERVSGVPSGIDALLMAASGAHPELVSMAELILAWRAAVGTTGATVSPRPGWSGSDSARRLAARQLVAAASAGRNPYLGLRSFDEADAGRFFGRVAAVDALQAVVRERRLVTIVGPSGSGKSSTLAAGLVPALRADGWRIVTMTPGEHPLSAMRDALLESAVEPLPADGLDAAIASVAGSARSPLLVVVDQAEECWTRAAAPERDAFLDALAAAPSMACRVHVVFAVRADFYGRPLQHAAIGPMVAEGSVPLAPMSAAELEDAIVLPAAAAGVAFDDGVVAALVAEAAAHPASLPMLQFTLAELYEKRVDGRITAGALAALGGISGAVGKRAEEVYAALGDSTRPSVREVFGRLVTPGEGVADTRRRARLGELSASGKTAVDEFVAARLLVTDNEVSTREPVVEVAHEALLVRWPRLHEWVENDRQWLTQLQHLAGAARSWDAAGRPESELYRGARLESALEALPEHEVELTESEIEYVRAGRAARDAGRLRERRTARRLRMLLATVAVALVASLVAGSIAVVQSRRAQARATDARRKALIAAAGSLRGSQRDLAVLLAAEADRLNPSVETRSALFGAFTDSVGLLGYRWFDPGLAPAIDIATIDAATVAVLDSNLALWLTPIDANGGASILLLDPLGAGTGLLATNADRSVLAVFRQSSDHIANLATFDVGTRQQLIDLDIARARTSLAVSPDGTYVALAGGPDGGAEVRRVADGRSVGLVSTPGADKLPGVGSSAAVAFAADFVLVGTVEGGIEIHHLPDLDLTARLQSFADAKAPPTDGLLVIAGGSAVVGYGSINGGTNQVGSSISRWELPGGTRSWTSDQHASTCNHPAEVLSTGELWCGGSGQVRAIDAQTGETRSQFSTQQGTISALAPLADGRHFVGASASFPVIAVLDGAEGGPITTVGTATSRNLMPGGYRADGRYLLSENRPGTPAERALIDVVTGEVSDTLEHVAGAAWVGNTWVGYVRDDGTAWSYNPATRIAEPFDTLVGTIDGTTNDPGNNRTVLWMTDGRSFVLDMNNRTVSATAFPRGLPPDLGSSASFSPDGSRLAVIQSAGLELLDPTTGASLASPVGGYHTVVAGADVIVAGDVPGRIFLLDPQTLQPTRPAFNVGVGPVDQLELSRDGRLLMARGSGGTAVRLYDVGTGSQLGGPIPIALRGRWTGGSSLRPDGRQLAVPGQFGISLWNLDPAAWHTAACQLAGRNLTKQEWDQYLGGLAPYHATCPQFATG